MPIVLHSIGTVTNGHDRRPAEGWTDVQSLITIEPRYSDGLLGIEDYSHLLVLFWLDRMDPEDRQRLRVHPIGSPDLPLTGVFATRSQFRPNPIAVTRVRLISRSGHILTVAGLDALDKTPVLDIKGDMSLDQTARIPAWAETIRQRPH